MDDRRYVVTTPTGLIVYGPDKDKVCAAYVEQAIRKGSKPGFLRIQEAAEEETTKC